MATTTPRLRLHRPTGGDPATVPDDLARLTDQLDELVVGYDQGTLASRPAAGVQGRMYYSTDDATLYYDTGPDGWVPAAFQPGMVQWSAASGSPPVGWLVADGSPQERARYPALFARIGTAFGAGNGSTTFNLPNLCGRTAIGTGQGTIVRQGRTHALTNRQHGVPVGDETHSLTGGQNGTHAHSVWDPGHGHNLGSTDMGGGVVGENGGTILAGSGGGAPTLAMGAGGWWIGLHAKANVTGISLYNSGGGEPHNNMQPSLALQAWIKT